MIKDDISLIVSVVCTKSTHMFVTIHHGVAVYIHKKILKAYIDVRSNRHEYNKCHVIATKPIILGPNINHWLDSYSAVM